jgi:glycolate oxidase FAD binding subunit
VIETIEIDGHGPLHVHQPDCPAGVCELVQQQRAKGEAVYPVGGRTMLDFGLPPKKPGIALDLTKLNQVIDYPSRDMTITVQAGITFAKLQETLAKENQWLPLDVPDPERMTLGGLIACNVSGPRRYGYGTLRDYLIGITFVSDDGVEVKGGGRVVKNVAGYDLMKLHIGALGTLGIITQVTLKVLPKPEAKAGVRFDCERNDIAKCLDLLQTSRSRPVAVEFRKIQEGGILGLAVYEQTMETVEWQLRTVRDEFQLAKLRMQNVEHRDQELDEVLWSAVMKQNSDEHAYVAVANMKPSSVASFLQSHLRHLYFGEPLNGVIWMAADDSDELLPDVHWIVRRAPAAWKTPERVFGKPTPAFELMRIIKRKLDPNDVFNPGRMFSF